MVNVDRRGRRKSQGYISSLQQTLENTYQGILHVVSHGRQKI